MQHMHLLQESPNHDDEGDEITPEDRNAETRFDRQSLCSYVLRYVDDDDQGRECLLITRTSKRGTSMPTKIHRQGKMSVCFFKLVR